MTTAPHWRKSSFSGQESSCVELAGTLDAMRDSKNPNMVLPLAGLEEFVRVVKDGRIAR